jgi:hypothetical protein
MPPGYDARRFLAPGGSSAPAIATLAGPTVHPLQGTTVNRKVDELPICLLHAVVGAGLAE